MKKIVFLLALAAATLCAPARAQEEVEITYQDFYDGLSSYGDWVYVDGYGYCWQPRVEEGWRPYTNGGWVYTDAGWTWSSDEEWGWATDHYGRWMRTTEFGWLWVPGYEWAPRGCRGEKRRVRRMGAIATRSDLAARVRVWSVGRRKLWHRS